MMKQIHWFIFLLFTWMVVVLFGGFVFAETPVAPGAPGQKEEEFLFLSEEMKQFLDSHVMTINSQKERLQTLIESIFDRSLLNFEYSNQRTYSAAETFKQRTGNCLSYTAMFVVMARYVGIKAYFQEVYDFSSWTKRGELVVFNLHMNALVEVEGRKFEVDFDLSTEKKIRRTKIVGDLRAQAHYYNNVGAEALVEKNYNRAESFLKKAIHLDPQFSPPWTNLGLLYQYKGKFTLAEASYKKAMCLDKHDYAAQVNLAKLFKMQKKYKEAERINKQIQDHYQKNPFYHYSLGQTAFAESKFELAAQHFKRAVRREPKEAEFYARLAAAYFKLGHYKVVEGYLKKARKLAKSAQQRTLYHRKLNYLYSHWKLKH